jgi:hypothetical protein
LELPLAIAVYGYMNVAIFKVYGAGILVFEFFLLLIIMSDVPRAGMSARSVQEGLMLFSVFLVVSTVLAVGLIHLHRWAAMSVSALGVFWSLALATLLGYGPWQSLFVGFPVIFGLLLPLYATIENWAALKPISDRTFEPFVRGLRSSDRFHLE